MEDAVLECCVLCDPALPMKVTPYHSGEQMGE